MNEGTVQHGSVQGRAIDAVTRSLKHTTDDLDPATRAGVIVENLIANGIIAEPRSIDEVNASVFDLDVEGGKFLHVTVLVDDIVEEKIATAVGVGITEAFKSHSEMPKSMKVEEVAADARAAALNWFYEGRV